MNNKWNNKSGAVVKRTVVFALALAMSTGMLTACTGGKKQENIKRAPSSQTQQKDNDIKNSTAGTANIQGTENNNVPGTEVDKGAAPDVENKDADKNTPAVEEKDADKNMPADVNKDADKMNPVEENKDTAGTEQKDAPAADSDKKPAEEGNKDTAEAGQKIPSGSDTEKNAEGKEQKETDAGKNAEGKEQKNDKK